jgi:iron complex outermembrane recepter protein
MSSRKPLSVAVHRALYSVAICSTAASAPGLAQEQAPPDALEEITVTGSRIATDPNLVISSPVTQLTAEEFNYRGITRVEDLINDLPQITPELTANESNGATGTATLDLRGLESDRTLVLVNGHRMGFGDPFVLAPDVNQIPGALVERVELLTGGASSTYGSDAVSGVVNFIMKDDFEGFQLDYQYSAYQHSNDNPLVRQALEDSGFELAPSSVGNEGGTSNITLTVGTNTEDGRGNVTAYLGHRDIEAITQDAYMFSACALDSDGANACGGSATSAEGLFTDFGAAGPLDGLDPDSDAILGGPYFLLTPEGDQFVSGVPLFNYGPLNHFQRPDERYTAGAFAHYDINENMTGYAEVMFMDDRSLAQIAPSGAFFVTSTINCQSDIDGDGVLTNHPLLSDQQFQSICENDRVIAPDPDDEGPLGVGDDNPNTAADEAALAAGVQNCVNGTLTDCPLYIGRRNVEGGNRVSDLRHTSYRFLGGLRGDINDNWSWDASANFARLIYSNTYQNDFSIRRVQRALDVVPDPVTGEPVCASVLNGVDPNCVPYNVFQEGGVTQEALDYLIQPLFAKGELSQDQFVAFVSGDLTDSGFVTPWASDGVEMVFGAEYREETFDYNPDQNFQSGDGAGQGGPTSAVAGAQDVSELFTEFRIPIAQDMPFAQALSLDLRYRYSDYSTGIDADTYNIGGSWVPTEGLKFRGGFSRAVRAPNIRELFAPQSLGLWGGTDPCAGSEPELTQEQCERTGVTPGRYGTVPTNPAGQYNAIFGGNPDLGPETSDSITAGVVLTGLMNGLTLSVDYWSIEIADAISTVDPELIINRCGVTGDPLLCGFISRGSNGNLWLGQNAVVSTQVNIGSFDVAGVDVVGNYLIDTTDFGSFDLNLRGTWLSKFDEEPIPGADTIECAGFWGSSCGRPRPEWKHTFSTVWQSPWDTWSFIAGWRYVGEVEMFDNPDGYVAKAHHYFDLTANYTADWFGGEETVVNVGVSNLTDNDPPVSGLFGTVGTFGNGNTIPSTWDALGRYWFVGLTQRF